MGLDAGIRTAGIVPYAAGANYTLSVLPMFILIGYLAYYAGITQTAFEAARRWFGWLPGGLATGTVFAVAGFSAVSGASSAAAAVFAKVAIPEMLRAGYNKRLAAGVCAAGATLELAHSAQHAAGRLRHHHRAVDRQAAHRGLRAGPHLRSWSTRSSSPIRCWRQPELGPPHHRLYLAAAFPVVARHDADLPGHPDHLLQHVFWLGHADGSRSPGGIRGICFRTQERHQAERVAAMPARLGQTDRHDFHRDLGCPDLRAISRFFRPARGCIEMGGRLKVSPIWILMAIYLLYFVLGTVLEGVGMFLLTLPIIFPIITSLGYDPIWFGIVLVKLSGIASLSPPVGLVVFVVNGVRPDISVRDIFAGVWPFIFADVVTLGILTAFPEIVTFIIGTGD